MIEITEKKNLRNYYRTMCDERERIGGAACWFCSPRTKLICSEVGLTKPVFDVLGRQQVAAFQARGQATATLVGEQDYSSEGYGFDDRPTETEAMRNIGE